MTITWLLRFYYAQLLLSFQHKLPSQFLSIQPHFKTQKGGDYETLFVPESSCGASPRMGWLWSHAARQWPPLVRPSNRQRFHLLMATRRYVAYLLRMWQTGGIEGAWCGSLEDPHTGKRTGFADVAEMVAFLTQLTREGKVSAATFTALMPECTEEESVPAGLDATDQSALGR
jgi:hypothetical protein